MCHCADVVSFLSIEIAGNPPSTAVTLTDGNFKNNFVVVTTRRYWVLLAEWLSGQVFHRNLSSCGHKVENRLSYTLVSSSIFNLKPAKSAIKFIGFVAPTLELLNKIIV